MLIHFIATGIVFVAWAFHMFLMLFRLTRRSLDKHASTGGGYFTWVGHSLRSFGEAATSEQDRKMRLRILWLGLILLVLIGLTPWVAGLGS